MISLLGMPSTKLRFSWFSSINASIASICGFASINFFFSASSIFLVISGWPPRVASTAEPSSILAMLIVPASAGDLPPPNLSLIQSISPQPGRRTIEPTIKRAIPCDTRRFAFIEILLAFMRKILFFTFNH